MEKLLYINNYNCINKHKDGYPDQHMWGADALSKKYNVICADVPKDLFKKHFKGSVFINCFCKSLKMLIKYWNVDIVYSACGELTDAFALANILHVGKRKLFKIQHHGTRLLFPKGYTKILFISPVVKSFFPYLHNVVNIEWGGATVVWR